MALIEVDGYFNSFSNFIAQANMNVPLTANADSIPFVLFSIKSQAAYRMYTNSHSAAYSYGMGYSLQHNISNRNTLSDNATHNSFRLRKEQDGLEDGFNSPGWMVNVGYAAEKIWRSIGAGISWRWQNAFYWQSFLVSGEVPAYSTIDAYLRTTFASGKDHIKLGATNLFNDYYISFLGGPQMGAFYYTTLQWDIPAGHVEKRKK